MDTSKVTATNFYEDDVLWNHMPVDKYLETSQRTKREVVLKESNGSERKNGIKLPLGYNRFDLPKPDDGPMPIFVFMNISKILDWDELNEVIEYSSKVDRVSFTFLSSVYSIGFKIQSYVDRFSNT